MSNLNHLSIYQFQKLKKPKRLKPFFVVVTLIVLLAASVSIALFILSNSFWKPEVAPADYLLQYEWPQFQGDSSFTRFSAGPAPDTPDILWKTNITGIQSYVAAFNGKIFVTTKTAVFALDRETGSILWNTTAPAPGPWPAVYKIDETHLVIGNSSLDIDTGRIIWTSDSFSATPRPLFAANVYSPEERMFYTKVNSHVQAWDFSDPENPPKLAWETYVSGSGFVGSGVQYGDGKVFPGSFEPHQMALDAKTGKVLWDTETKCAMLFSGSYYEGRFFRGGSHDNTLYCFNATTGKILWTFNPNTEDGYFCIGTATAYGMVYALNRDGYLYALDADNGDLVWKYKGPGLLMFPGNPTVADGKVYATTGQTASYTGVQGESEFACFDAYTGHVLWKLPIEAFAPRESVAIAYGNLYLIPGDVTTAVDTTSGEEYATLNQVWAIGPSVWPMWRRDAAHSASGVSGPTYLTLRWKFTTNGAVVSSPSIVDGIAYFGSQDKNIYAISARDGRFIWKFATQGRIESSPAVVNGKVYTGADDGYVYCLDAYRGNLLWKTFAGGDISASFGSAVMLRSSPAVVEGRVYVGSLDTNLYCLDADEGDVKWTFKTEGYITSSPAVADGAVYVISQEPASGALYKLDAITGDCIWKTELPYQIVFTGGTDIHSSPTVAEGIIFAATNAMEYYGIDAATGKIKWTYSDPSAQEFIVCSPIYNDGKVFLIDKFSIVCVNAESGRTVWSTYLGDELYVSPSYAGGKLYVVTDQRSIHVINATNGEKLSRFETGSNSWSAPTIYAGKLYVGNNDWNVYCLADPAALDSYVTVELAASEVVLGESIRGSGNLVPGIAGASVLVSFVRPNGTVVDLQVAVSNKGAFNFAYKPDVLGNWTVVAQWQSNKDYYASSYSAPTSLEVTEAAHDKVPVEYTYAVVAVLVVLMIMLLGYAYVKRGEG
ncbi:MAG: PQQ-binding-like beta-propeller repeat protein [Candidatus Bathyarchaeota archaeon]|nr:PQQ-binding-like beta-propeller repeat protein [Candidatus Bathyarchaeota archaeon]